MVIVDTGCPGCLDLVTMTTPTKPSDDFHTAPDEVGVSEAGRILGVGPDAVRAYGDAGMLTYRRTPGGHRRFKRTAVEALRAATDAKTA